MDRILKRIQLVFFTRRLRKENLILIHGFANNSILLRGFIDYLEDFFNVYPIDLPGFNQNNPSLFEISIQNYTEYVEQEIKKLPITNYILGGVSFGFFIANNISIDLNCKGIFAMEPYVGIAGLKISKLKEKVFKNLIKIVLGLNFTDKLWQNIYFPKILHILSGHSKEEIKKIVDQINPTTFFQTAKLILENEKPCVFKEIPYMLAINKEDKTIDYNYVLQLFQKNLTNLFVFYTKVDHYPKEMTVSYFRKRIRSKDIYKMIKWVNSLAEKLK